MVKSDIESSDCQVVVVGAGPAGSATAYYLASSGFRVVLVDQHTFPRDKVCGDFVGPIAQKEIERLGITKLPSYKKTNEIKGAAAYLDGRKLISKPVPKLHGLPSTGRVIPRFLLDKWLLDCAVKAGTKVLEGFRATGFESRSDGVTLTVKGSSGVQNLRTQLLVGADGSNSTVARALRGHSPPNSDRIVAIRGYFADVNGPSDQADLYFSSESFPGYSWLFPTGEGKANVGIGVVLETIPPVSQLRELLNFHIKNDVALSKRLKGAKLIGGISGWPLTIYNADLPVVADRVMLVGDAAGLINPLNGEGIQYALLSGRWASETAAFCITNNSFSKQDLSAYSNTVERELRHDLSLSGLIVQLIRNRSLNPIWLRALELVAARAKVDSTYADIVGGIMMGSIPSSQATNIDVVSSTIEQALLLSQNPAYLVKTALDAVQIGIEIARQTTLDPHKFINWVIDSAAAAAESVSISLLHNSQGLMTYNQKSLQRASTKRKRRAVQNRKVIHKK